MQKKNERRQDGRLQSKVYLGKSADGKLQYKYVYASTQRELDAKVQEIKTKLGKGLDVSAERDRFSFWKDKWEKLKAVEVSAGRYATYKSRVANLEPLFGMEIGKIRTSDIQDIILDLAEENPRTGKPMARSTLKEVKGVASQIFELAIENRVIDYNPARSAKIPKDLPQETKRALTKEEQSWIDDTPHRAQTAAMIMLYAGLRRGELIPLQWRDVDLVEGTISVNKAVEFIKGSPHIKPQGKTKAATRKVYIPNRLIEYLRPLKDNPFALICPNTRGGLMSSTSWKRMWESYITDLNMKYGDFEHNKPYMDKFKKPPTSKFSPKKIPIIIPHITAHWLRHTFITNMYLAGVDVLTAKEQAGHSDIQTTLEIYTHLDAEHKKKGIDKMNEYLDGPKSSEETAGESA